jgi:hypothetical protein
MLRLGIPGSDEISTLRLSGYSVAINHFRRVAHDLPVVRGAAARPYQSGNYFRQMLSSLPINASSVGAESL